MKFVRMLLDDNTVTELFFEATDEKASYREEGLDFCKGEEIPFKGKKYRRDFTPLTVTLF